MFARNFLFAVLAAASTTQAGAFTTIRSSPQITSKPASLSLLRAAAVEAMESEDVLDEKGNVLKTIEKKRIQRTWKFTSQDEKRKKNGEFDSSKYGKMRVNFFLPPDGKKPKGCVFFMHGFSQYPKAYTKSLKKLTDEAEVAVVAVETGLTSKISFDLFDAQFALQRAVSQDTVQCIEMLRNGEAPFEEYNIDKNVPVGLCGHSMGAGLCFPVAAQCEHIEYLFAMAPVAGVGDFEPIQYGIDKRVVPNSILLAGAWDRLAKPSAVEELGAKSNGRKSGTSMYGDIDRGLHTGFEDTLVLFNVPLQYIFLALFSFGWTMVEGVAVFLKFFRADKSQLEASRDLMAYLFEKMVKSEDGLTLKGAEDVVLEYEGKIDLKFPEEPTPSLGSKVLAA